jgi:hypothetical protein
LRAGTIHAAGRAREEIGERKSRAREMKEKTPADSSSWLSMLEPSSEKKKRRKGGTVTLLAGYRSMVLLACFPAAERAICMHALHVPAQRACSHVPRQVWLSTSWT